MTSQSSGTQAVDRAAMLLAHVVHGTEPVSFTELTTSCGLAKSTTSRLLTALERHQLVRRDDGGRFWPGALFVGYAWRGTADTDLIATAQPFLDRLGAQTGETINLGIVSSGAEGAWRGVRPGEVPAGAADGAGRAGRESRPGRATAGGTARAGGGGAGSAAGGHAAAGDHRAAGDHGAVGERRAAGDHGAADVPADDLMVQQIAQVNSRFLIGGTNWVGLAVPLHCSALGKVLLAFGAAPVPAGQLHACTLRTITGRNELAAELAQVRARGYAVTDEELEPGLVAVAAPVFAGGATAIAAISVSAPASRLTPDQIPGTAARCAAAARDLSAVLAGPQADRVDGSLMSLRQQQQGAIDALAAPAPA